MRKKRAKKSGVGRASAIIDTLALLPWWICIVFSIGSFVYFHSLSSSSSFYQTEQDPSVIMAIGSKIAGILVPAVFLTAAGLSYFARAHRKTLLANAKTRADLAAISWHDFELLVGEAYRQQGYKITENKEPGPDGGIDLILQRGSEMILVQCKHWKSIKVGVEIVREIYGVMAARGAHSCKVVTSGQYTEAAREFAYRANKKARGSIELIDAPALFRLMQSVRGSAYPSTSSSRPPAPGEKHGTPSSESITGSHLCPQCGGPMRKIEMKNGAHIGKYIFGCIKSPICRGYIPAEGDKYVFQEKKR